MSKGAKVYQVAYKLIDGAHFFVSADPHVEGLCAASADLKLAFEDVTHQLSVITGAPVEPGVSFDAFQTWLKGSFESAPPPVSPTAELQWGKRAA